MACLLFYHPGCKKWPGFLIHSPSHPHVFLFFFCSLLSVQPSSAEKLTVPLIFDTAMEQTKGKKKGAGGWAALHGTVKQHLIVAQ